jgi:putative membrane protein
MFSESDSIRIGEAVTRAEALSDGEIVTIVAERSDDYRDVVERWALLAPLVALTVIAIAPGFFLLLLDRLAGRWEGWSASALLAILTVILVLKYVVARWLLGLPAWRGALVPGATKARRVRRRAILLFRLAAENRTRARTGILLYLSLAERRAELVADASINARVPADTWGHPMAALIEAVRDGRPGDGMVAAVEQVGAVLAQHFPRSPDDTNELPDRLIIL